MLNLSKLEGNTGEFMCTFKATKSFFYFFFLFDKVLSKQDRKPRRHKGKKQHKNLKEKTDWKKIFATHNRKS